MPPAVVGDGAVGVDRHDDGRPGEHADRRERDTVEAQIVVGDSGDSADNDHRHGDTLHADRHAANDVGRRAGSRRFGNLANRTVGGVILGHQTDQRAADRPDAQRDRDRLRSAQERNQNKRCSHENERRQNQRVAQHRRWFAVPQLTGDQDTQNADGKAQRREQERQGDA